MLLLLGMGDVVGHAVVQVVKVSHTRKVYCFAMVMHPPTWLPAHTYIVGSQSPYLQSLLIHESERFSLAKINGVNREGQDAEQ